MFLGTEPAAGVEESAAFLNLHELSELMQALPGFLMLVTGEGKLLYLSDSVSEHLGHSMVSPNGTNLFVITRSFHRLWEKHGFLIHFSRWIWWHRGTACTTSLMPQIT